MDRRIEVEIKGASTLAYWTIPLVLGLAAAVWLSFFGGWHAMSRLIGDEHKADTLQARMNNRVGVAEPIKNPVTLIISKRTTCMKVDRAFLDGNSLTMYITNHCPAGDGGRGLVEARWTAKSPNGINIASDYTNNAFIPFPEIGETTEARFENLPNDERIASITVSADGQN